MNCAICSAPYHESTGHRISDTSVWCGVCTRAWVKELCSNQHRRWGGVRFYDHAKVPPPAKEYLFTFVVGDVNVTERGVSEDEAYHKAKHNIGDRKRVSMVTVRDA